MMKDELLFFFFPFTFSTFWYRYVIAGFRFVFRGGLGAICCGDKKKRVFPMSGAGN
jgi:hypothetical protein